MCSERYIKGQEVAATMYQAFGCIDSDVLPEGEWVRVMEWLSAIANGEPFSDLLPVSVTPEYQEKMKHGIKD